MRPTDKVGALRLWGGRRAFWGKGEGGDELSEEDHASNTGDDNVAMERTATANATLLSPISLQDGCGVDADAPLASNGFLHGAHNPTQTAPQRLMVILSERIGCYFGKGIGLTIIECNRNDRPSPFEKQSGIASKLLMALHICHPGIPTSCEPVFKTFPLVGFNLFGIANAESNGTFSFKQSGQNLVWSHFFSSFSFFSFFF